ncbi:hypothetical protein NKG94_15760 [Micromonospora sp. M12]
MEPVGWGVIGCGWVARDHVAPAIRAAGHRLVAACDPDRDAARALAPSGWPRPTCTSCSTTRRWRRSTSRPQPHPRRRGGGGGQAGLPVLCEASGRHRARRPATGRRGRWRTRRCRLRPAVPPAHQRIADLVADGDLGTVTAIRIVYGCWLPERWSRTAGRTTTGGSTGPAPAVGHWWTWLRTASTWSACCSVRIWSS